MSVKITWHGHSCYTFEKDGYVIAVDPYDSEQLPGYTPLELQANEVLTSHEHYDHNYLDAVTVTAFAGKSPFSLRVIESFHDDTGGSQRGNNRIHLIEAEGTVFAHFGDYGQAELTRAQQDAIGKCDVLIIPVGGHYTIDAEKAAEIVKLLCADVVIPAHYRFDGHGPEVISGIDPFLELAGGEIVKYPNNSIVIDDKTNPHVAVLSFED